MLKPLAKDVIQHRLKAGDKVKILDIGEKWITVSYNERIGVVKPEDFTNEQKTVEGLNA